MKTLLLKLSQKTILFLIIGIPLILEYTIIPYCFYINNILLLFEMQFVIITIPVIILFLWYWSVGTSLKIIKGSRIHRNAIVFKIVMIFPILFYTVISLMLLIIFSEITQGDEPPFFFFSDNYEILSIALIVSICCFLYATWLVCWSLNMLEKNGEINSSEVFKDFELLLIFPIGIWTIQPRINKVIVNIEFAINENKKAGLV